MRVAFISYEFPPDTGIGGIGTYVFQLSQLLVPKNIEVHVFCGSVLSNDSDSIFNGVHVHRLQCPSREEFRKKIIPVIKKIHGATPLSIIEAPEYSAESLYVKDTFPDIPLIVKLHTPQYLLKTLNKYYRKNELKYKLKKFAGIRYNYKKDVEYLAAIQADGIITPSVSLGEIVSKDWNILQSSIQHLPNPYIPNQQLLNISSKSNNMRFGFLGRMEIRKGIVNLTKAIPLILQKIPEAQCWLIGADSTGPYGEKSMKAIMKKAFAGFEDRVKFIEHVPLTDIPGIMAQLNVCVYPSLWENFPNVCLEAMTAARGIVASANGGMADMLLDINGGILIDPHQPEAIAEAVISLLSDNKLRAEMGERSREKVINYYSSKVVDDAIAYYKSKCR